ncbi:MAG: FAD-binding oxidoreductase [Oceanospirillaceae bacterium]|nr:FAD-binding oxidoreductase [Oceanospirillaceae bacterium]MAY00394.1 FAD-binding oxidoreductase [Oceanospirillaceae bacterium]MBL34004.1 FAD-binding oxidoreductase [Oceanospirillaceae bacterium]MBS52008.1 FAD-binding oxidoreductase [Oceanospirillaceae bacterium]
MAESSMTALTQDALVERLSAIVGSDKVRTDDDSLQTFGKDWTKIYEPKPAAIVFPKTTEQVRDIVLLANEYQLGLVPSGGRTGLSAGAVAANGEIVVAFDYMNQISEFNAVDRTVKCGAGVITEQLQNYAEDQGLFYPVDFASAGSSQIGGNIGTNAGGIKVIRWGMTRDWVAGLTVVTGKGDILRLNKDLLKNNTGYDMRQLFIGGEGTLGFVTEATMRLTRPPKNLTVLVLGIPELDHVMDVLNQFQSQMDLTAFEFFSDKAMQKVLARGDVPAPFESSTDLYALIEFEAITDADMDQAMTVFEQCLENGWVMDGVISQSETQAANLWRLREDISETISEWTPYKNDISVVVSKVPPFLRDIDEIVTREYPDFEIIWFGHIGDGNLHLNILKPDDLAKEDFFARCGNVSKWVFEIVEKYDGSVSAEHGVGMTKKPYLEYTRSTEELAYMKAVKAVFDPNNVMNPGKLVDL